MKEDRREDRVCCYDRDYVLNRKFEGGNNMRRQVLEWGIMRVVVVEFGLEFWRFASDVGQFPILLLILGVCVANEARG